jgi:hypothetical protein
MVAICFGLLTLVFVYTTLMNVIEQPDMQQLPLLGLLALVGLLLPTSAQEKSSFEQRVSAREINVFLLSDGSGIWSKPPSVEFYKRRAAIAAMAFRYAKHHPGHDYRMAAIIGVGVNDAYPTITVRALDIATYIQNRDRSIPWNVCRTAGEYMETWVNYSRLGFDTLAASEILSQGVSNGLNGKIE